MGIFRNVKAMFHTAMCRTILQQMDASETATACELAKKISLLDGITALKGAWEDLDAVSIRNCWVKAGLKMGPRECPANTTQTVVPIELDIPLL